MHYRKSSFVLGNNNEKLYIVFWKQVKSGHFVYIFGDEGRDSEYSPVLLHTDFFLKHFAECNVQGDYSNW